MGFLGPTMYNAQKISGKFQSIFRKKSGFRSSKKNSFVPKFALQTCQRKWATPRVLWKKATRAIRAMRGKALETVPFQPYFGCTESFLRVLSDKYCQATKAMRAKQAVTVPLQPYLSAPGHRIRNR